MWKVGVAFAEDDRSCQTWVYESEDGAVCERGEWRTHIAGIRGQTYLPSNLIQ